MLDTTQITHDGVPKLNGILTDGSRLFIIETNGAGMFLAQASVTGGDTSVIPTPFTNIAVTDISRDHSHLLAVNFVGTETESQLWALPVAAGRPRELSDLVGHSGVWSSDGRQLAFAKGSDIYIANADGTNARKLITVSGAAYWIRFSPDGSRPSVHARAPGHIIINLGSPCGWYRFSPRSQGLERPTLGVLRCLERGWTLLLVCQQCF